MSKKWICKICGYVHTGDEAPEFCPQCKAPSSKFEEQSETELVWADEHRIGVAQDVDPEIVEGLRQNFTGECTEVGMYLAMSRQAAREGYPEIAEYYKTAAFEEAEQEKCKTGKCEDAHGDEPGRCCFRSVIDSLHPAGIGVVHLRGKDSDDQRKGLDDQSCQVGKDHAYAGKDCNFIGITGKR